MKKILMIAMIGLLTSVSIFATQLVNKDSKTYKVKVSGAGTTETSISGNTTNSSICSRECTIEVEGVGSIKITGNEKSVIIENGKIRVEN